MPVQSNFSCIGPQAPPATSWIPPTLAIRRCSPSHPVGDTTGVLAQRSARTDPRAASQLRCHRLSEPLTPSFPVTRADSLTTFSASATLVQASLFIMSHLSETSFFVPSSFVLISSSPSLKLLESRHDRFCRGLREAFRGNLLRREVGVRAAGVRRSGVLMSLFPSVCWTCGSSTGRLSASLNHKYLSFVALELWEPGVSLPRERQRSCRCAVAT